MTPAPKRRWFRFSLKTLFVVVTLLGVLLAWLAVQVKWIRDRHAALEWVHASAYSAKDYMPAP